MADRLTIITEDKVPIKRRKSNNTETFTVITEYGTNEYPNLVDVVEYLFRNQIFSGFSVRFGEDDYTDIVYKILSWKQGLPELKVIKW